LPGPPAGTASFGSRPVSRQRAAGKPRMLEGRVEKLLIFCSSDVASRRRELAAAAIGLTALMRPRRPISAKSRGWNASFGRRDTAMIYVGLLFAALTSSPVHAATPVTLILAVSEEGLPERLRCAGTEPFWSLSVDNGEAVFETPEAQGPAAARFTIDGSVAASNRFGLWALRLRSQAGQESLALVRQAACSDGMSDVAYAYTIALLDADEEGSLLDGCCE
jgi:uncharacterized membrane protein